MHVMTTGFLARALAVALVGGAVLGGAASEAMASGAPAPLPQVARESPVIPAVCAWSGESTAIYVCAPSVSPDDQPLMEIIDGVATYQGSTWVFADNTFRR